MINCGVVWKNNNCKIALRKNKIMNIKLMSLPPQLTNYSGSVSSSEFDREKVNYFKGKKGALNGFSKSECRERKVDFIIAFDYALLDIQC